MFRTELLANVTPTITTYNEAKYLWRKKLIKQRGQEFYEKRFLECAVEMIPLLNTIEKTKILPAPYSLYVPTNYKEEWKSSFTSIQMMIKCCEECGCRLATWEEYWFYRLDQIINETVDLGKLFLNSDSDYTLALLSQDKQHIALAAPKRHFKVHYADIHVVETNTSILFDNVLLFSNTVPLMVKVDKQYQTSETHQLTRSELEKKLEDLNKEIDELEKQEKECNVRKNKLINEYNTFLNQYKQI